MDEKINTLEFLNQSKSNCPQLLTTNDRIIKLWKLENKQNREYTKCQVNGNSVIFP